MSDEFRIWTQNLYQKISAARVNRLQDAMCFFAELDQSALAPATALNGLTAYYHQAECQDTIAGGQTTIIDSSRDWRNRLLLQIVVQQNAANNLPSGINYDPDGAVAVAAHQWYTGSDFNADPLAGGGGHYWEPMVGLRFAAVQTVGASGAAQGDFIVWNQSGATKWFFSWIEQTPDAA